MISTTRLMLIWFLKGACRLDARERLDDAFLDVMKHPSDNGQVALRLKNIRQLRDRGSSIKC